MTQRQYDRLFTTLFCGACATVVGLGFWWVNEHLEVWLLIPGVALYAAWLATDFRITNGD